MKSPFVKTLIFALLAVVVSGVAAAFYPWPERVVESEMVGKPLFESYDTSAVFKIRILKFDPARPTASLSPTIQLKSRSSPSR